MVQFVYEEMDMRSHVNVTWIGIGNLHDATSLGSREQENGALAGRTVICDVNDLFRLKAIAGCRIIKTGVVLLGINLNDVGHVFQFPFTIAQLPHAKSQHV